MPRYAVTIHKALSLPGPLEEWTNVYHVDTPDLTAALDLAVDISIIEQAVHKDYVIFRRATAVEDIDNPPPGGSRALTGGGDVAGNPAIRLPPFNTVRVIFSDGDGRPSQKYLRLPLQEDDITDGTINVAVNNLLFLSYTGPLLGLGGLVSNSGATFTEATVFPGIQMRQTDWKRRTRPGFKRGWVPV